MHVKFAARWGAIEWLFVCDGYENMCSTLVTQVTQLGGKVVSLNRTKNPEQYHLISQFSGLCATLRFELPEDYCDDDNENDDSHVVKLEHTLPNTNATLKSKSSVITSAPTAAPLKLTDTVHQVLRLLPTRFSDPDSDSDSDTESSCQATSDEVSEEIEAMEAIYPFDVEAFSNNEGNTIATAFHRIESGPTTTCLIAVRAYTENDHGKGGKCAIAIRVVLPNCYPHTQPAWCILEANDGMSTSVANAMVASAQTTCQEHVGDPVLFSLVLNLQQNIEQHHNQM